MSEHLEVLEEANQFIFVKKFVKAKNLLEKVLSDSSWSGELLLHLRLIELSACMGELEILEKDYLRKLEAKELEASLVKVCLALIEIQNLDKEPQQMIDLFQSHINEFGASAAAYYGLAFVFEWQGDYGRALFNYKHSIDHDKNWYPAFFGLSQVMYKQGEEKLGDHYFYLFEHYAPLNLYGNFETHRNLSDLFLQRGDFAEARQAIILLSKWWYENKGFCPYEVQIYEDLMLAKIANQSGVGSAVEFQERAKAKCLAALADPSVDAESLHFIGKVIEEFLNYQDVCLYYGKLVMILPPGSNIVVGVIEQFLYMRDYSLVTELLDKINISGRWHKNLESFSLLSKLHNSGVAVEKYMQAKELAIRFSVDKFRVEEAINILESLRLEFDSDSEVYVHLGVLYRDMGMHDKALACFKRVYSIDGNSSESLLYLAESLYNTGDFKELLGLLSENKNESSEYSVKLHWLRVLAAESENDLALAVNSLEFLVREEPWEFEYLNKIFTLGINAESTNLLLGEGSSLYNNLFSFADLRKWPVICSQLGVVGTFLYKPSFSYIYAKLHILYQGVNQETIKFFIEQGMRFDPTIACTDLMKLLNTNFDSHWLSWGLGVLYKEIWQLEISSMWLERALNYPMMANDMKAEVLLDLADNYLWRNQQLKKALEYISLSNDIRGFSSDRNLLLYSHACLCLGDLDASRIYLEKISFESRTLESEYLRGLINYRCGMFHKAKLIWKPLLTSKNKTVKDYHVKQRLLEYYFGTDDDRSEAS